MLDLDYSRNGRTLNKLFIEEYFYNFDCRPPEMSKRAIIIFNKLIMEQGGETAQEIVEYVFKNWSKVQKELHINSFPTPQIIFGFRFGILSLIKKESFKDDEYVFAEKKFDSEKFDRNLY